MGYTHYWTGPAKVSDEQWNKFADDVTDVLVDQKLAGIKLCYEYDQPNKHPMVTNRSVRFNGDGPDGHETFQIVRGDGGSNFCKTAQKPYDTAVVACLVLAKKYLPGFEWSSDGDDPDLADGFLLANKIVNAAQPTVV